MSDPIQISTLINFTDYNPEENQCRLDGPEAAQPTQSSSGSVAVNQTPSAGVSQLASQYTPDLSGFLAARAETPPCDEAVADAARECLMLAGATAGAVAAASTPMSAPLALAIGLGVGANITSCVNSAAEAIDACGSR